MGLWDKYIAKDPRRRHVLVQNTRVRLFLMRTIEGDPTEKTLSAAWRIAEALQKNLEQFARGIGLKLGEEIPERRLDSAAEIIEYVHEFYATLSVAMNALRESDSAEYEKVEAELKAQRTDAKLVAPVPVAKKEEAGDE